MTRAERARALVAAFAQVYPDAHCELDFSNPLELLVATILSAQCTDKRVNLVTPVLFKKYKTAAAYAETPQEQLEAEIRTTGFFRSKAKSIRSAARDIVEKHKGKVPDTMESLTALAGVGRKTANVVLGNSFGKNEGVVVDTHVTRLSNRLHLTKHSDAEKIEQDLMKLIPRERWTIFSHWLIWHGPASLLRPQAGLRRLRSPAPLPQCVQSVLNGPPATPTPGFEASHTVSILDRLLGRQPDPTEDWPRKSSPPSGFDLARRLFGSLAFGADLESARFLGRPDSFKWVQPDYCELLYARSGFQIDFDHGRFAYLAFFLGPNPYSPSHPDMVFSQPRFGDEVHLTPGTSKSQLHNWLGSPESEDADEEETILFYTRDGVTMEFEYDTEGALKRCNLYPK